MSKKSAMVVLGLLVLCAPQGWAGSMGNGAAQRASMAGGYTFCYAGNSKVVYFTQVLRILPKANAPNLGVTYGSYIKKTYGLTDIDRQRCITAVSKADTEAVKERFKKTFSPANSIENEWGGISKLSATKGGTIDDL